MQYVNPARAGHVASRSIILVQKALTVLAKLTWKHMSCEKVNLIR